eukprot:12187600-Prorocentrum_lima.AAC.1
MLAKDCNRLKLASVMRAVEQVTQKASVEPKEWGLSLLQGLKASVSDTVQEARTLQVSQTEGDLEEHIK